MGQQQLLLLVLSIVIVGIAIVVGINTYAENSVRSNWDSLLQEGLRIANDAQSWKQKPELFGGQVDTKKQNPTDFTDVSFTQLGYASDNILDPGTAECYRSLNGVFQLTPSAAGLTITGQNLNNENQVVLVVDGNLESNINLSTTPSDLVRGGALTSDGSAATLTQICGGL